jgi:16S rRNA (cytidine1402-2'-O)-methyltransferase
VAGKIYLIPVHLGSDDFRNVIPEKVLLITRSLRFFVVENLRSSRRYLRLIDKEFPIDETHFFELNEHTDDSGIDNYLDPVRNGFDLGVMSEAGLPGIADPGAKIIALAHRKGIKVVPLSGPSSIIMALIASGLNGQNFSFNGYLPVKPSERTSRLKELEIKAHGGYAQIFMETPYRNQRMLESILETCNNSTSLCIATDISLDSENIRTLRISEWKKNVPAINDRLAVFILQ